MGDRAFDADRSLNAFESLRKVRLAARKIARDESLGSHRYAALVRLVDLARHELADNPFLQSQVRPIVHAEGQELFERGQTPRAPSQSWQADPVTIALWRLRRNGLERCPTCSRGLPTPEQLARQEDLDRAAWAELDRREHAPDREADSGDVA